DTIRFLCQILETWAKILLFYCQVSRTIGDVYLKEQEYSMDPVFRSIGPPIPLKQLALSAEPSIQVRKLKPNDMFLIFASDGP
ncbi:Os03g0104100, partial [Oryza sativa Japonica Group]